VRHLVAGRVDQLLREIDQLPGIGEDVVPRVVQPKNVDAARGDAVPERDLVV